VSAQMANKLQSSCGVPHILISMGRQQKLIRKRNKILGEMTTYFQLK
jgi:3-dehydroquinate dehydratase